MTNTGDEWVIDVSLTASRSDSDVAFVPLKDGQPVFGLTYITTRSPGPLVGVVSQHGLEHAKEWVARNPSWQLDYCHVTELTEVVA